MSEKFTGHGIVGTKAGPKIPAKIPVHTPKYRPGQNIRQNIRQISDFIYTKNPARPGFGFYLHKELARDRNRIFSTQRILYTKNLLRKDDIL